MYQKVLVPRDAAVSKADKKSTTTELTYWRAGAMEMKERKINSK